MAEVVYLLCGLAATGCALLLLRSYRRNPVRLLLFTCVCFAGLALNNVLLFVDKALTPQVDMSIPRAVLALGSALVLLYGLVWDSK